MKRDRVASAHSLPEITKNAVLFISVRHTSTNIYYAAGVLSTRSNRGLAAAPSLARSIHCRLAQALLPALRRGGPAAARPELRAIIYLLPEARDYCMRNASDVGVSALQQQAERLDVIHVLLVTLSLHSRRNVCAAANHVKYAAGDGLLRVRAAKRARQEHGVQAATAHSCIEPGPAGAGYAGNNSNSPPHAFR